MIDKDTILYGSFSKNPGNNGCLFFNKHFEEYNINAIYKSFAIQDIKLAIDSAKILNFGGFAVSMPFKKEIIRYLDSYSNDVKWIGACNTVVNQNGKLIGYNTDYIGIKYLIKGFKEIIIVGNGGLASAAKYAAYQLDIKYDIITRKNWEELKKLKNKIILNCTPVKNIEVDKSNQFIDCLTTTKTGMILFEIQAKEQFYLYTGIRL